MPTLLALLLACARPAPSPEVAAEAAPTEAEPTAEVAPLLPGAIGGDAPVEAASTDAPQACLRAEDCGADMLCEGLGCGEDQPGQCVSNLRPCTADLRPYCGCDGQTFLASGTCPGRRYSAAMPCPGAAPGPSVPLPR